jgi:hypothetical protein
MDSSLLPARASLTIRRFTSKFSGLRLRYYIINQRTELPI